MPKFVDWIPTQPEFFDGLFEICPVGPDDIVYDLGSGDGRLLFAALERGVGRCVGIEIIPDLVKKSNELAEKTCMSDRIKFIAGDILDVDISPATVIYFYMYSDASSALRPKFERELKPGTRLVVLSFPIPGWKPNRQVKKDGRDYFLYIMPFEKTADYETAINDPGHSYY
jgi:ubiquinone/menaquinone biosynthesis C-methylase UbiE